SSNNVSMLRNNGDGTFQQRVNYSTGVSPFDLVGADFDNDGDIDIGVADAASPGYFTLLKNRSFISAPIDSLEFKITNVGTASDTSVIINNFSSNSISVANITTSSSKFSIIGVTNFIIAARDSHT